jgi:HAD superfamily hydrolase (TIGR01509 family)
MIEGVVFDMDGVLIDSHPVHRKAWRRFLATVGKRVSDSDLEFILEGRRRDDILRYFLGDLSPAALVEYGHRKDRFFEENFNEVKLIPGVGEFLDFLQDQGLLSAIATSASSSRTWAALSRLRLKERFVVVITGDDVAAGKPDPAVYRLAAERMNMPPERLLAIEDAPCGVRAAKAAGLRCVGIASNGRAEELLRSGAHRIIPNFVNFSLDQLSDA